MKTVMNFTTSRFDTQRYENNEDLKNFYRGFGLDGVELMVVGEDEKGIVKPEDAVGSHMRYFTGWMDLWTGNTERLIAEFGNFDEVEQAYAGKAPEALSASYRANVEASAAYSPEYYVFHVSECQLNEAMNRNFYYTSESVINETIKLVNSFSGMIGKDSYLLFENLWYPGLDMLDPALTQRLLEGIDCEKVGVMLDTGHLINTNNDIRTIDSAVDYINFALDAYSDLSFIKGIHLNLSLSGEYAENLMATWKPSEGTYNERKYAVMPHIYNIDPHHSFSTPKIKEVIERVSPDYLCLEFLSSDRASHAKILEEQLSYLR
jgi:hypothetical protein